MRPAHGYLACSLVLTSCVGFFAEERQCDYAVRWATVRTLHQVMDGFLARTLCRLDGGSRCQVGRDGRPFYEGRTAFAGSDGEWAVSGHSGESVQHTKFLFDIAFQHAPKHVCEVGFNVGHSAVTLLVGAGSNTSYLGFDLPRLNQGVNEEFFEMVKIWIGAHHKLEMRWGDAGVLVPHFLAQEGVGDCELVFYDGAHDVLSVLRLLPLLKQLAVHSSRRALVVVDDVRCSGPLCGHSALAWDFLVWAGIIEEIRCQASRSVRAAASALVGDDFGACLGRFVWGSRATRCSSFNARCVAKTYQEPYVPGGSNTAAWLSCCLNGDLS